MTSYIAVVLIQILLSQGIGALFSAMTDWKKIDPDMEDINKLLDVVKPPESYFK